jgi:hypothetical protein
VWLYVFSCVLHCCEKVNPYKKTCIHINQIFKSFEIHDVWSCLLRSLCLLLGVRRLQVKWGAYKCVTGMAESCGVQGVPLSARVNGRV